ncbi:hypothetical protein U1Q18_000221 [Sarracenia purpurea var. burkii]
MVIFAATTILSANILCDCYRSPDPEFGPTRNRSYMEAVKLYLGMRLLSYSLKLEVIFEPINLDQFILYFTYNSFFLKNLSLNIEYVRSSFEILKAEVCELVNCSSIGLMI